MVMSDGMTNDTNRWAKTINDWLAVTGMVPTRLGQLATANPRAVDRIRDGAASVATLEAVLRYIEANPAERKRR